MYKYYWDILNAVLTVVLGIWLRSGYVWKAPTNWPKRKEKKLSFLFIYFFKYIYFTIRKQAKLMKIEPYSRILLNSSTYLDVKYKYYGNAIFIAFTYLLNFNVDLLMLHVKYEHEVNMLLLFSFFLFSVTLIIFLFMLVVC